MPKLPPIKRPKLMRGLKYYGLKVETGMGKGSHYKLYSPDRKHSITIPQSLEGFTVRKTIEIFLAEKCAIDLDEFIAQL